MGVHNADYLAIREALGIDPGENEPLFIIRGQDALAVAAIARYQTLAIEAECDQSFINGLNESIGEFADWQHNNAESVKKPD